MVMKAVLLAATGVVLSAAAWIDAQSALNSTAERFALPVVHGEPRLKLAAQTREALFTQDLSQEQKKSLQRRALKTLASEPLDATALWAWGAVSGANATDARFQLAERVTRRELGVQMELLRAQVTNNDLASGFRHLDRALTVSPEAGATLLPGIAQSLDRPEIRQLLIPYAKQPWFAALVRQSVEKSPDPLSVAALLTEANKKVTELSPDTLPSLLRALISAEEGYEAGQLAVRMDAVSTDGLEQFGVSEQTLSPKARPLTWQLANSDAASVKPGNAAEIVFTLEAGRSATLLDRVTIYRAGTYILGNTLSGSDTRLNARWEMRCVGKDGEKLVWSQRIPVSEAAQRSEVAVTIPEGCPAQRWQFKASASDLQVAASGEIKHIDLQLTAIE